MVKAFDAARTLASLTDWSISNLQMQKMLYIAHMFYIGETQQPLITNQSFEAWDYGPVLPVLYHKLKIFGARPVRDILFSSKILEDGPEYDMLKMAAQQLHKIRPGVLVHLTHRAGGAWARHYCPGGSFVIPDEAILEEYRSHKEALSKTG